MAQRKYKGYLIDLDGTMYRGAEKIPAAPRFIKRLREAAVPFMFLTNNSTATPKDVAARLTDSFEIEAYEEEIYTSSLATADYLTTLDVKSVYVIGEKGLREALKQAGFQEEEENPDAVVVGLDQKVTYKDFEAATLAIHNGAHFICTNKDTNLPTERGLVPGAGSLAALLETSTRQKPLFVGKPESIIMDAALNRIGMEKNEVLMVGDNYETDILAGIENGVDTLLVFTGFTSEADLKLMERQPTHTVQTLDDWIIEG